MGPCGAQFLHHMDVQMKPDGTYWSRMMVTAVTVATILTSTPARASEPGVAIIPVSAQGVTSATTVIVQETIASKAAKLGFTPQPASKVASSVASHCPGTCTAAQALAVGKDTGAAYVLLTVIEQSGNGLHIRMDVWTVSTAESATAAASTDTSGLLAASAKLTAKVMPDPATASLAPALAPVEQAPGPMVQPHVYAKPKPVGLAKPLHVSTPPLMNAESALIAHLDDQYDSLHKRSTALMAIGGLLSAGGLALTVTSIVSWVTFVKWQEQARDSQCIECIEEAKGKIRTNAILTGVSAAVLLPGIITLGAGITQRMLALKLNNKVASFMPGVTLAMESDSTHLLATWTF